MLLPAVPDSSPGRDAALHHRELEDCSRSATCGRTQSSPGHFDLLEFHRGRNLRLEALNHSGVAGCKSQLAHPTLGLRPPALVRPETPPRPDTPTQRYSPNSGIHSPKPPRPPKPVTPLTPPLRPFAHKLRPKSAPATVYLTQACPEDGAAELSNYIHVNPSDELAWCEMVMCNDLVYNVAPHARVAPRCVAMGPLQRKILTGASEPGKRVILTPYLPPPDLPTVCTIEAEYIAWYPRTKIAAFSATELQKSLLTTLHNQVLSTGQQTLHMSASGKMYCLHIVRLVCQSGASFHSAERGRVDLSTTLSFLQSDGNPVVVLQVEELEQDTAQHQDQNMPADVVRTPESCNSANPERTGATLRRELSVGKSTHYAPPRLVRIPGFPLRAVRPSSVIRRAQEHGNDSPSCAPLTPPLHRATSASRTAEPEPSGVSVMRTRKASNGLNKSQENLSPLLDRMNSALDRSVSSTQQNFMAALDDFHASVSGGAAPFDSGADTFRAPVPAGPSPLMRFSSTGKTTTSTLSRKTTTFMIDAASVAFLAGANEVRDTPRHHLSQNHMHKWNTFGIVSCLELLAKKKISKAVAYVPSQYLMSPQAQEQAHMTKEDVSLLKELEAKKFVVSVGGPEHEVLLNMVDMAQRKPESYIVTAADTRDAIMLGIATADWVASRCVRVSWDPDLEAALPDASHPAMLKLLRAGV